MLYTDKVGAIPLNSLDTSTLGIDFAAINPTGIPEPCFLLRIINGSNIGLDISYDGGATMHDYVLPGGTVEIYTQANNQPGNNRTLYPRGTIVSVMNKAGGVGYVHLAGYFQR